MARTYNKDKNSRVQFSENVCEIRGSVVDCGKEIRNKKKLDINK